jgi:hypothetical protein
LHSIWRFLLGQRRVLLWEMYDNLRLWVGMIIRCGSLEISTVNADKAFFIISMVLECQNINHVI